MRRKNSSNSYIPGLVSTKNSFSNLKKTNVSTNNSTEITNTNGNISGIILKTGLKTSETSSRPISGANHKKSNPTTRQSKDNIINVSEASIIVSRPTTKEKDKLKER